MIGVSDRVGLGVWPGVRLAAPDPPVRVQGISVVCMLPGLSLTFDSAGPAPLPEKGNVPMFGQHL